MVPQLNPLFCFQLLQTSLKALGRLMVVLLETETTSGFFQNIVHVSTCGSREEASMVPVNSRNRGLGTERTMRGDLLLIDFLGRPQPRKSSWVRRPECLQRAGAAVPVLSEVGGCVEPQGRP